MIKIAGEQAKRNYDRHTQEQPGFKVGDKILLRHDNIATTQESRKLAPKFLGPYPIIAKISDLVYKLKLPETLHIHDIFHVSLLEKYWQDTIPGRKYKQPPPIITPKGDIEWKVNKILDSRISSYGKKLQYLVSWEGYGLEQNSREPANNLKNAPEVVKKFHLQHPQAPRLNTKT